MSFGFGLHVGGRPMALAHEMLKSCSVYDRRPIAKTKTKNSLEFFKLHSTRLMRIVSLYVVQYARQLSTCICNMNYK